MRSFHGPNLSQNGEAAVTTHPPLPNKALTQTSGHFSMSKPTQPHRSQLFDILCRLAQTHSPFSLCLPVAKHSKTTKWRFYSGLAILPRKHAQLGSEVDRSEQSPARRGGRAHASRDTFGREGRCENTVTLTRPNGCFCGIEKQTLGVARLPFSEILSGFPWIYC